MTRRLWLWNRIATCALWPMTSSATQSPVQLLKLRKYHFVLSSPVNFICVCSAVVLRRCWILSVLKTWSRTCPPWDSVAVAWYLPIREVRCVENRVMVLKSTKPSVFNCHRWLNKLKKYCAGEQEQWTHSVLKNWELNAKWCSAQCQRNDLLGKVYL
jgi:hypothetical protein